MSKLEKAIEAIADVFGEFAVKDEKKRQLSNEELDALLKAQLSSPEFQYKIDRGDIQEAVKRIDRNRDGQVNIREFCLCLAFITTSYYRKKHNFMDVHERP